MSFVAFSLSKGAGLESWLSKVLQGFADVKDDQVSLFASFMKVMEASEIEPDPSRRLFMVKVDYGPPAALWIIGFIGSLMAYMTLGYTWVLVFSALLAFTGWFFTSHFLKSVMKLSLRKNGYDDAVTWYYAEDVISLAGMRTIADIHEEVE